MTGLEPRRLPVSDILERRAQQLAILRDWEGAERSGLFADNFFMDNRLKDVVEPTKELNEEAREIRGLGEIMPLNQLRGTFVLEGEKQDIHVFFTLTPEKNPLI